MLPVACMLAETWVSPDWAFPLTAVFSPLVHLCPVAGLPLAADSLRPLIDKGQVVALSPALAEPVAARLRTLAGALSGSEAASHSAVLRQMVEDLLRPNTALESSRALLQELRDSGRPVDRGPTATPDALIRERILLLLTAQAKRDQAELAAGLAGIGRRQQAMFADMGENTGKALEPESTDAPAELPLALLRAWLRLLAHTHLPCSNPWFVTGDTALAVALLAQYRQRGYGTAITLPKLFLPTDGEDTLPTPLLHGLAALQEAGTAEDAHKAAHAFAHQIADEAVCAAPAPGLACLELHVLPGATLPDLLTGLIAEEVTTRPKRQDAGTPCLFGVFRNSSAGAEAF